MPSKKLMLVGLWLAITVGTSSGAQKPVEHGAKPKTHVELRLESLEQKVTLQRFEIDQLKKELLARDEEIHALSEMIDGDATASPGGAPDQDENEFQAEIDLCHSMHFVGYSAERSKRNPVNIRKVSARYRY